MSSDPKLHIYQITHNVLITDDCKNEVTWMIGSITINEGEMENTYDPDFDLDMREGDTVNDIKVIDGKIYPRAERKGNSVDGRVYSILLKATDDAGNETFAEAEVTVPHDQQ